MNFDGDIHLVDSVCSTINCQNSIKHWWYCWSGRLQIMFIFGRCDIHSKREIPCENYDIADNNLPDDALPISKEMVDVISVMKS